MQKKVDDDDDSIITQKKTKSTIFSCSFASMTPHKEQYMP